MRQLHFAIGQLMSIGTPEQVAEARRVLGESRRAVYRMLAGDEDAAEPPAGEA